MNTPEALWDALIDLPGARRRIWNHVLDEEVKAGHDTIEDALLAHARLRVQPAASPASDAGVPQGAEGQAVADVTVWHYKGATAMENWKVDYYGSLPPGTHLLYASPPAAPSAKVRMTDDRILAIAEECEMFDDDYENCPRTRCDKFARAIESEVLAPIGSTPSENDHV
jgi:hypothetical protein